MSERPTVKPRRTAAPIRKAARRPAGGRASTRKDDRRTQLLDAARHVFAAKGFDAATVDDITRSAGVAKGTFYLYFDEKRQVLHVLVRTFLAHIQAVGASIAREVKTPADFYARTMDATTEILRVFVEHQALARIAYRESMGIDRELERMLKDFYQAMARVEADNIRLGIALAIFRDVDPVICAWAHIGMVERVALALLHDKRPPSLERIATELLSIGFEGLKRRR